LFQHKVEEAQRSNRRRWRTLQVAMGCRAPPRRYIGNMADTPPDRLSNNPKSPHFDMPTLQRGIGVRFKGRERTDVEEYCISEGWIRVQAGKAVDRHGLPVTVKLQGPLEVWFADVGPPGGDAEEASPQEKGPGEEETEAHPS
jgi:hypothetical protein